MKTQLSKNDLWQMQRGKEALIWLAHPQRKIELLIDKAQRVSMDIKNGHSPLCALSKCHNNCPSLKK